MIVTIHLLYKEEDSRSIHHPLSLSMTDFYRKNNLNFLKPLPACSIQQRKLEIKKKILALEN